MFVSLLHQSQNNANEPLILTLDISAFGSRLTFGGSRFRLSPRKDTTHYTNDTSSQIIMVPDGSSW